MSDHILAPSAFVALQWLGAERDVVARGLRERGFMGIRRESGCCPIARYLLSLGFERVCVSPDGVVVAGDEDEDLDVSAPPAVVEFIHAFDEGVYPDLIDHDAERLLREGDWSEITTKQVLEEPLF